MKLNLSGLLATLSQPSTYAGLSGIALAAGVAEPKYTAYSALAATIAGIVAIAVNEKPAVAVTTVVKDAAVIVPALTSDTKVTEIAGVAGAIADVAEGLEAK